MRMFVTLCLLAVLAIGTSGCCRLRERIHDRWDDRQGHYGQGECNPTPCCENGVMVGP